MALNVSAWAIRQPLPSIVIMAVLVAVGFISFTRMPITRMPNIDVPVVSVVITQFGASPIELESQVSKKVEDAVAGVEGVNHLYTVISDGIANTTIEFRLEIDTDRALNDVKDAVTRIRHDLPRGIDDPMIQRYDIVGLPILTYAAIAPGKTPEQLSFFVADVVVRKLQGLRGVGSVERIGSVEREIRVGLNPVALQGVGITALDVSRQLRGSNADLAGGRSEIGGRNQAIRTLAGARTLTNLAATRIALPRGGDLRLDDIGLVSDTIAEPSTFARFNGAPLVGFSILRAKGASDVEIEKLVSAEVENIRKEHPEIELKLIDSSVTYTLGNYDAALENLFEGAVLAIVVVFLFLRDWRATIIAALTLPLSILPSFWVMHALGFSLNVVSLLAIVLSTGILVDDAIVEVENIIRHMRMGKTPYQAALEAADEIGLVVIAISLTIVAVFLPAPETARSTLAIELPPGSRLADTQALTDTVTNRLNRGFDIANIFVDGGKIPPLTREVSKATLTINYVPKSKRTRTQRQLEQAITRELAKIPDFRFWFVDDNAKRNLTINVTGEDSDTVANVAFELALQMRRLPQVANIVSSTALDRPELRIYPRRDLAVRLGVSTESLSETIRVATIGDVGPALARYDAGNRSVPIRVLLEEHARADRQVLEQLRVPSPRGVSVPLNALADIDFGAGPISINRYDRQRQARVEADLVGGVALSEAFAAVRKLPIVDHLPPGVRWNPGGDAEQAAALFEGFGQAMRNGLIMVYALLAVLFTSLVQPLTILLSLPLSIAGAILALLLGALPITTPVVIGILMLMGIVSKNAIMLVDFAVEAMHRGMERNAAITDAGLKRARPIVMTTIAMLGGMGPSALGIGAGGEFRSPMAIAVIGGLLVSTLLSLLFVPAVFTIMDDFANLCWRFFRRFISGGEVKPAPAGSMQVAPAHSDSSAASSTQRETRGPDTAHPPKPAFAEEAAMSGIGKK